MAQTTETITFAQCGHTDRVQVRHNSASERDRKREWLADTALCPACDLAEKAETAAKSDLVGSVKQIAWAERIRAEMIRKWETEKDRPKYASSITGEIVAKALANTQASWWIDNRDLGISGVLIREFRAAAEKIAEEQGIDLRAAAESLR